jgi:formylmethanofuran dehydrogenase subunit B
MPPAGGTPEQEHRIDHVTCLGCGCACDDIGVRVSGGRIAEAINACALGLEWFGDGTAPAGIRVENAGVSLDVAFDAIVAMLAPARAPRIYLAPDLSSEAQRAATALADLLHAALDTISHHEALSSLLAAQERGRASATLGEIRNRADVIVFWGVDPDARYPRYRTRYAPEPAGLHVPDGRRSRTVIAVDVGDSDAPADADVRVSIGADDEVALLTAIAAIVRRWHVSFEEPLGSKARSLATALSAARYSAIVADGEGLSTGDPQRAGALIALAQALNTPSRCALSTLRGGGNRSGADAVLTSQTGYPTAIDFSRGFPAYRPHDRAEHVDATVIIGNAAHIPAATMSALSQSPLAIIGPHATAHASPHVAIDTGIAGIHCGGTAVRMDDVPLPLRPSIDGHRDPADVITALIARLAADGPEGPSLRNSRRDRSLDRSTNDVGRPQ